MHSKETLLLTRADVAELITLETCIPAVETAFRAYAEGRALAPGVLSTHVKDGAFHIKSAGLPLGSTYFAAKINANFPQNRKLGLPTIQGLVVLFDAKNGYPLAVMDSIEITIVRTGAATAVAAKYLAREDADTVTIWGCGNQGRVQLKALAKIRRLKQAFAYDLDPNTAERFAKELSNELNLEIVATNNPLTVLRQSGLCVTCTPSKRPLFGPSDLAAGTFVAAVGADNPEKQELDPALFASNKIVVDILDQCAAIGDLHHAIEQGFITPEKVHAELGEIVTGKKPGREFEDETILFDCTGTALQDTAAAAIVYENALKSGKGTFLDFQQRTERIPGN
jgi:alanine dehydrogenase